MRSAPLLALALLALGSALAAAEGLDAHAEAIRLRLQEHS